MYFMREWRRTEAQRDEARLTMERSLSAEREAYAKEQRAFMNATTVTLNTIAQSMSQTAAKVDATAGKFERLLERVVEMLPGTRP